MRILLWIVGGALAAYLVLVLTMYLLQRRLVFPVPQAVRVAPAAAGFAQAEEVVRDTPDGARIILWLLAPQPGKPVVLFFHGNGDVLAWRVPRFRAIVADGTGLVALSFRGYGGSTGAPTETSLVQDGLAAHDLAVARYPAARIVPWGYSLGSGVAVAVAAARPVAGLILEAPYTSLVDVAAAKFPYLPVRLLLRDPFRSDQRIAALTAPLLVMHGDDDAVIPISFGRQLHDMARVTKRFVGFPRGTHTDLDAHGAVETAHAFLDEVR
jgi:fermentation-respiration switch protein FrsA (DUF1100 family)